MEELDWANMVVAGSYILVGILVKVIRRDKPNDFIGFRTKMSKLNESTWKMGNESFSNGILWITIVTLSVQIFFYLTIDKTASLMVSAVMYTAALGIVVFLTQVKLKKNFNKDGSAKHRTQF